MAPTFPVSVKGVVFMDGKVVLLKNERDEWELPGGRLEPDEDPAACVVWEIAEELGVEVTVDCILDSWLYDITTVSRQVVIVTYLCRTAATSEAITISEEHQAVGLFDVGTLADLTMPDGYRASIVNACDILASG